MSTSIPLKILWFGHFVGADYGARLEAYLSAQEKNKIVRSNFHTVQWAKRSSKLKPFISRRKTPIRIFVGNSYKNLSIQEATELADELMDHIIRYRAYKQRKGYYYD